MSRYTVDWTEEAQDELAEIWMQAADRAAVTAAQATIDRLLASDPLNNGTDVAEELRKLVIEPLIAFYSVYPGQRLVQVSNVVPAPP